MRKAMDAGAVRAYNRLVEVLRSLLCVCARGPACACACARVRACACLHAGRIWACVRTCMCGCTNVGSAHVCIYCRALRTWMPLNAHPYIHTRTCSVPGIRVQEQSRRHQPPRAERAGIRRGAQRGARGTADGRAGARALWCLHHACGRWRRVLGRRARRPHSAPGTGARRFRRFRHVRHIRHIRHIRRQRQACRGRETGGGGACGPGGGPARAEWNGKCKWSNGQGPRRRRGRSGGGCGGNGGACRRRIWQRWRADGQSGRDERIRVDQGAAQGH